jgi:hypothetical protein
MIMIAVVNTSACQHQLKIIRWQGSNITLTIFVNNTSLECIADNFHTLMPCALKPTSG